MKKDQSTSIALGLLFAIGFPAIAWAYFDWRAGLLTFIALQTLILFSDAAKP